MKTILVPTDFSKAANNAAEYAAKLAKAIEADVLLFHVYHVPVSVSKDFPKMVTTFNKLQAEHEMQLKIEAVNLKKRNGIEVSYIAKMGMAVDEIVEEEKNASIIIMGMHGASKFSEVVLGSITTATLRKTTKPVLIIPENAVYKDPEKIVFACDYDPKTDMHTIDTLKELIKVFSSKIYVVNVKHKKEQVSVEEAVVGERVEGELRDVEHVYFFSEKEDPVDGINEFVEDKQADMVAVIPHHYNFFERLFHKSVSKKMAFHTHVPLLALPENHRLTPTLLH
jgi:nucleotide-binding universal stress UspA family protein